MAIGGELTGWVCGPSVGMRKMSEREEYVGSCIGLIWVRKKIFCK